MKKSIIQVFILVALGFIQSQTVIGMERKKYDLNINVHTDLLTALYDSSYGSSHLYIPEEELMNLDNLEKIIENKNNNIRTVGSFSNEPWSTRSWDYAYKTFKEAPYNMFNIAKTFYTLDELSKLLAKAKTVTKSFLPPDDFSFIFERGEYIKKSGIRRLYTYAKLQQVILEKNLTHIRLPLKYLLIKNKETEQYASTKDALSLIDSLLKICINSNTAFTIEPISDKYTFEIFAKKEKNKGKGLSKTTMDELIILCNQAPFDIGFDNIFWDIKGDAIIIDTEHKNESIDDCAKLKRYPVDESIETKQKEEEGK